MIPIGPAPWEPAPAGLPLKGGTLEIWRAPVELNGRTSAMAGLTAVESAHALRMCSPARRAQYAAGHALLNSLHARHGAPLFTSLSHSGEWAVAAAARSGPVGIDVESLQTARPFRQLAHRFFPTDEILWLAQFPPEEQCCLFYALWTAKEALFKALGAPPGRAHCAARPVLASSGGGAVPQELIVEGCRVGWFSAAPGYLGAYAAPAHISRVKFLLPA